MSRGNFIQLASNAESGGNRYAKNPNSSASGILQYTDGTWNGAVNKYQGALGITAADKNDPDAQRAVTQALVNDEYAPALHKLGVSNPTDDQLYAFHVLGTPTASKLFSADPNLPASAVLGDSWKGVYNSNQGLFGSSDISAGEALNSIENRVSGGSHSQGPSPVASYDPAAIAAIFNRRQQQQPLPTLPDEVPEVAPSADPGNTWNPLSPQNLLRIGAGLSSGEGIGDSIGKALTNLSNGVPEDERAAQQRDAIAQQKTQFAQSRADHGFDNQIKLRQLGLDQDRQNTADENSITGRLGAAQNFAQSAISGGADPGQATAAGLSIAGGQAPQGNLSPSFGPGGAGGGANEGAGELYTDQANGHNLIAISHKFGTPTIRDLTANANIDSLPASARRAADRPSAAREIADNTASDAGRNAALAAAESQQKTAQVTALIPESSTGPDALSEITRHLVQLSGRKIGETSPEAVNLTQNYLNERKTTAVMQSVGGVGGRMDIPLVKAIQGQGASWANDPISLRAVLMASDRKDQQTQDAYTAWDNLDPDSDEKRKGYQSFNYHWKKDNPIQPVTLDQARQANADALAQRAAARAAAAPQPQAPQPIQGGAAPAPQAPQAAPSSTPWNKTSTGHQWRVVN